MTMNERLRYWQEEEWISAEQATGLSCVIREEPFSLFVELNAMLYLGVVAFVAGLGWTVSTWSNQLGSVVVVTVLSVLLIASFYYCFSRAAPWSTTLSSMPTPLLDYVLYLGCFVWLIDLAYLESRFHLLSGQWDAYLLTTSMFFFFLTYRFDNRLVLSLSLSSLAGWFGVTFMHWHHQDSPNRQYALLYCLLAGIGGILLRRAGLKPHFFNTYLHLVANVLFITSLSGVFDRQESTLWIAALLLVCGASFVWGLTKKQFAFIAYSAVYGYVGVSWFFLRDSNDEAAVFAYFVVTAVAMVGALVVTSQRFGRAA